MQASCKAQTKQLSKSFEEFHTFTYAHTVLYTNKTRELIDESERERDRLAKTRERERVRETDQTAITDLNGGGLQLKINLKRNTV